MKIAIQSISGSFSEGWIPFCNKKGISVKAVDVYAPNAVEEIKSCDAFMWHWDHASPRDWLFARQILMSLGTAGVYAFPNIETCWHFDDKVGQKYLFEACEIPAAKSWVFYDKASALNWAETADYPIVFKLRGGAGSTNVRLVRNFKAAKKVILRMFGRGFMPSAPLSDISTKLRHHREGGDLVQKLVRAPLTLMRVLQKRKFLPVQRGYVYFQEFIPGNRFDTRIVVIGDRAIGIRRYCRPNDFRASGSGALEYKKENIPLECVRIAFEAAQKLKLQVGAFDFVQTPDGRYLIVEVSYGFTPAAYGACEGCWSPDLQWHDVKVDPEAWMVEEVCRAVENRKA